MEERFYKVRQVADIHQCDQETVLRWIETGELEAINISRVPDGERPRWRIGELRCTAFKLVGVKLNRCRFQ